MDNIGKTHDILLRGVIMAAYYKLQPVETLNFKTQFPVQGMFKGIMISFNFSSLSIQQLIWFFLYITTLLIYLQLYE
jgi:hypothetical protein